MHIILIPSFLTMDSKPLELKSNVVLNDTFKSLVALYDKRMKLGEQASDVKILEMNFGNDLSKSLKVKSIQNTR